MARYTVLVTDRALADMEAIYSYITEVLQVPDAALGQYNRIADAIMTLEEQPNRIKVMDFEMAQLRGLRRLNVDNYAIVFFVNGDKVIVTNVLYGASDIEAKYY